MIKKILFTLILGTMVQCSYAQAPQAINYQAIARDNAGMPINSQNVSIRLSILTNNSNGNLVYSESHNLTTNTYGLINLKIGTGAPILGLFSNINWGADTHFLKIDIDQNGGNNYTFLNTSQLVSVPYALHAETVTNKDDADANPNNELQTISKSGAIVSLSNNGGTFTDDINDADADPNNEIQNLSITGSDLTLSNGNTVTLPTLSGGQVQSLSKTGNTITLSPGGGSITDDVNDADADPNNEIQNLSINGQTLSLSNGNSITLPSNSNTIWQQSANNIYYNTGNVGIATLPTNTAQLTLAGKLSNIDNSNQEIIALDAQSGVVDVFGTNGNANVSISGDDLFAGNANLGNLSIYNTAGTMRLTQGVESSGYGYQQVLGNNGNNNVYIGALSADANQGYIAIGESQGYTVADIQPLNNGSGLMAVYGASGAMNAYIGCNPSNANYGQIGVADNNGDDVVQMYPLSGQEGFVGVFGTNGNLNLSMGSVNNNSNYGYFAIHDDLGYETVSNYTLTNGAGYVDVIGPNGFSNITLNSISSNANKGLIALHDAAGYETVNITTTNNDAGLIETFGYNGNSNFVVSTLNNYPNNGYVSVNNSNGNATAGMYVDNWGDGVIFGNIKNFKMEHPTDVNKEIWYASLEGPEAGAYERGTQTLNNGKVFVPFSEHFEIVANANTLTVSLTPLNANSKGLAVIEKTAKGFWVQELYNGVGNYDFDWEVKAVRKGYERYEVIRDKATTKNSQSTTSRTKVAPKNKHKATTKRITNNKKRMNLPKTRKLQR